MKRTFYYVIPVLMCAMVLSACSSSVDLAKRRYNRGYHIDGHSNVQASDDVKTKHAQTMRERSESCSLVTNQPLAEEQQVTTGMLVADETVPVAASFARDTKLLGGSAAEKEITKKLLIAKVKKMKKADTAQPADSPGSDQLIALVLCFFVGVIGIHRFYLGYYGLGILHLLTLGACGIWTLIDFIRIITGDLKPKDGEYKKTFDDYF